LAGQGEAQITYTLNSVVAPDEFSAIAMTADHAEPQSAAVFLITGRQSWARVGFINCPALSLTGGRASAILQ
jgi:hypothetical protein